MTVIDSDSYTDSYDTNYSMKNSRFFMFNLVRTFANVCKTIEIKNIYKYCIKYIVLYVVINSYSATE